MRLEIGDPVLAAVTERVVIGVPGVAGLHDPLWLHPARIRSRPRGIAVARDDDRVEVTVHVVLRRGRPVIDVVRAVQRSVRGELLRLTGLHADVVVSVVDLV